MAVRFNQFSSYKISQQVIKNYHSTFLRLRRLSLASVLMLLSTLSFADQKMGDMSYDKINKMLRIIEQHAKSPYTSLIATIKPEIDTIKLSDIKLTLEHEGKIIKDIAIAADGNITFPLVDEKVGEQARLKVNQVKGSIAMSMTAGVRPIQSLEIDYKHLFAVLDDIETVASELVGLPSWMIPDIDEITFVFDKPATATLMGSIGNRLLLTSDENKITLERDDDLEQAGYKIVFSELPRETIIIQ